MKTDKPNIKVGNISGSRFVKPNVIWVARHLRRSDGRRGHLHHETELMPDGTKRTDRWITWDDEQ